MDLDTIFWVLNSKAGTALGTLSSVISLVLTIFVFFNIRNIRSFYVFTARVPQLSEDIAAKSSLLNDQLNTFEGMTVKLRTLLAEVEVLLVSLSKNVDGSLKKQVLMLLKKVEAMDVSRKSVFTRLLSSYFDDKAKDINSQKQILEDIHVSLHKISAACRAKYEDARWER